MRRRLPTAELHRAPPLLPRPSGHQAVDWHTERQDAYDQLMTELIAGGELGIAATWPTTPKVDFSAAAQLLAPP
jgi:hypothetical protein